MSGIDTQLIALLPNLRSYARFLTGNRQDADDLVQDTALRLLTAAQRFEPGTNFRAWAFTVLRNRFLNEYVAKRRRTRPIEEVDAELAPVLAQQSHGLELRDLARQFMRLSPEYRSILALAAGENLSYEEIAVISNCAVGTVKSRVHRARSALQRLLGEAYEPRGQHVGGVRATHAARQGLAPVPRQTSRRDARAGTAVA